MILMKYIISLLLIFRFNIISFIHFHQFHSYNIIYYSANTNQSIDFVRLCYNNYQNILSYSGTFYWLSTTLGSPNKIISKNKMHHHFSLFYYLINIFYIHSKEYHYKLVIFTINPSTGYYSYTYESSFYINLFYS